MDIFGIKALKEQNRQLVGSIRALQTFNRAQSIEQIRTMIFPNWQSVKEIDSYIIFDDVYSVVSRLATASAQINLQCYNDITNEDLQPTDPFCEYVKTLTLEEKEIMYTWLYLTGEVFMFKDRVKFGPEKTKLKTPFMHPSFMTIIMSDVFPNPIIGFRYQDTQTTFTLTDEEVIYVKYFNPTTRYDERRRGMSPIKALAQRLTRLQANMSASVSQMQNGGVPSIVYDKTPGIDQHNSGGGSSINEEVSVIGQRKDGFSRFLRNSDNKGAPYFASGEMGVLQLGLSLVEMDALVMAGIDFDKICNAFSISSLLFNSQNRGTFNNTGEMRKDMYTNAILPNVTRMCNAISAGTVDVFGPNKCLKPDISKIPELQENMKEKAQAWAALPALVVNEMRLSMGMDELNDEMADKLIIKQGYKYAEDLGLDVAPIDDTANDYGNNNTGDS